jgi:hypothetical protein
MKLSEEKIRSIIREELLKEIGPGNDPFDSAATTMANSKITNPKSVILINAQKRSEKSRPFHVFAVKNNDVYIRTRKGTSMAKYAQQAGAKYHNAASGAPGTTDIITWRLSLDSKNAEFSETAVKDNLGAGKPKPVSASTKPAASSTKPAASTSVRNMFGSTPASKYVKMFQEIVGSKADGFWGPNTLKAWVSFATPILKNLHPDYYDNKYVLFNKWKDEGANMASRLEGIKYKNNIEGLVAFAIFLSSTKNKKRDVSAADKPAVVDTGREKKDSEMTGGETVVKVRRKGKIHIFKAKNARQKGGEKGSGFLDIEIGGRTRKLKRLTLRYKEPSNVTVDNISQTSSIWLNGKKLRNDKKTGIKNLLKNLSQSQLDSMFSIETK